MVRESMTLIGTAVSCVQCLSLITDGLSTLEGVVHVSADKQTDMLIIDYNSDVIDEDGIRACLRGVGFTKSELYCIC